MDNDLIGKAILDVGSSRKGFFAREVERRFPNARAFNLDYELREPLTSQERGKTIFQIGRFAFKRLEPFDTRSRNIAGLFTQLPFQDGSFDLVISMYAVSFWLQTRQLENEAYQEIIRVLRPGGKAYIAPAQRLSNDGRCLVITPDTLTEAMSDIPLQGVSAEVIRPSLFTTPRLIITKT